MTSNQMILYSHYYVDTRTFHVTHGCMWYILPIEFGRNGNITQDERLSKRKDS